MSIDKEKKSNRLLASRRYTHDTFTDAQESFTNVLDLQASEVYTQAHKIPSTDLPFSGSSQQGQIYTDGADNILKYYYRHKLTKSNLNNEVWFFLNPPGSDSGIGAQLIDSNQQTSFISPKYSDSSLANSTAEDNTPGYLAKVFISTAATSASVSDSDVISVNDYTFDYKTGVLQFTDGTVDPSNSQYVYMSVNQYVGKTLADGVEITGDISGSASSTGSFGHLVVAGNITASGVVRADAFESVTGGETIDFGDSVNVSGNVTATNLVADSGSVSDRLTAITQSISALKVDSGSFSVRLSSVEAGSTSKTLVSSSAQIADEISGSFTQDSASFSTRLTTEESNVDALQIDSASFSVRLSDVEAGSTSKTLVSSSAQIADEISGSFTEDSASFSTRITNLKIDSGSISVRLSDVEAGSTSKTLVSSSAQIADEISGSFTADSSSFSTRVTNLVSDSASFSTRITIAEGELENTLVSASKQLEQQISGSFTAPSASFSDRITAITSSIDALKIDSSSFSDRVTAATASIDALKIDSSSFSNRVTAATASIDALKTDSGSFSTRVTNLKIDSGSFSTRITDLVADSASFSTRVTNLKSDSGSFSNRVTAITSSIDALKVDSSSFSTRVTTEEINVDKLQTTSSALINNFDQVQSLGKTDNVLFSSITGSDDVLFQKDVVVQGKITAQEIHTEIESASIIFTSGSTRFGNTADDIHRFTGSIFVNGNLTAVNLVADSGSVSNRLTEITASINNLKSDSGSFSNRITAATASIDALKTDSGSFSNRITAATASINALKSDSGSFSTRITVDSSSFSTRVTNLVADSASFSNRITTAEIELENTIISASEQISDRISGSFTAPSASFSTRVTNLKIDSGSFSTRITADSSSVSDRLTAITQSISALKSDSGSFSNRITAATASINALKSDSGSFSTRITNFTTGNVELVSGSVSSTGSFGKVVTTDLLVSGESTLKNKVTLKHDSSNAILEFRSTGGSRINEIQNFNPSQIYNSLFLSGNNGVTVQDGTYSGGNNRASIFSIGHIDGTLYHQFGNANQVAKQTGMGIIDYENISGSAVSTGSFGKLRVVGMSVPDIAVFSSSLSTRITDDSASISSRLTTEESNVDALQVDSGSFSNRITAATASINALKIDSSSFSNRITAATASINALKSDSGSFSSRLTNPSVMTLTASKDVHFKENLKVDGTVTAQEFHTEVVSSSIVFTSGSTRFGNTSDDTHEMTGSLSLRGDEIFFGTSSNDRTNLTLKGNQARIQYRHYTNNALYTYLNLASGGSTLNTSFASATQEIFKIQANESTQWKFTSNILSGSNQTTGSFHHIHGASKLGVGTISPVSTVHISASDGIIIPAGTDAERNQNPIVGEIRFNTQQSSYEGYDGNNWGTLGGMTDVDKDTKITSEDSAGADNDELKFFTAGSERLRIFSDGHISASSHITASKNVLVQGELIVNTLSNSTLSNLSSSISKRLTSSTASIDALKTDSGSFSTRVTNLKTDSGSFSLRETNLETTSSALINNFDQVQSLGKTDSVVFSNITASNNTQLAGNVLMQSELNILGNITASGNISASGNLFIDGKFNINGISNFNNHVTMSGDLMVNSFNNLKVSSGRTLSHQLSMDVTDAWELDDDGNYMPAPDGAFVIDPRFKLDKNGNIHLRKEGNELWTDDVHTYFE